MINSIDNKESGWEWADNIQNVGTIKEAENNLKAKVADVHIVQMLHSEPKELRKDLGPEVLVAKCRDFLSLAEPIQALEAVYKTMWKRHMASQD